MSMIPVPFVMGSPPGSTAVCTPLTYKAKGVEPEPPVPTVPTMWFQTPAVGAGDEADVVLPPLTRTSPPDENRLNSVLVSCLLTKMYAPVVEAYFTHTEIVTGPGMGIVG